MRWNEFLTYLEVVPLVISLVELYPLSICIAKGPHEVFRGLFLIRTLDCLVLGTYEQSTFGGYTNGRNRQATASKICELACALSWGRDSFNWLTQTYVYIISLCLKDTSPASDLREHGKVFVSAA